MFFFKPLILALLDKETVARPVMEIRGRGKDLKEMDPSWESNPGNSIYVVRALPS